MSPEQACGKCVDCRSDIFSFGLVLYEILSGRRAFAGETAISTMAAILHSEPRPLRESTPAVPIALDRIVTRCLRKDPADRFQSMVDVVHALEDALSATGDAKAGATERATEAHTPSIAVLPFVNMNRDEESEFLSDGISEDITSALGKVPGLRVAPRASAFQFKGRNTEIRPVAEKLNVGSVLTGSVRRSGNRLRITVELIDAAKESQIWSERYDRVMEDIFDVQDDISRAIADTLKVKLTGAGARRHTADSVAYELYLQGRHHLNKRTSENLLILGITAMQHWTVLTALARAGGLTNQADVAKAVIVRTHADGKPETISVHLEQIWQDVSLDVALEDGDFLLIPNTQRGPHLDGNPNPLDTPAIPPGTLPRPVA
jgi:TolB-like protein